MTTPRAVVEDFYRRLDAHGTAALRDVIASNCTFVRPGATFLPGADAFLAWLDAFMVAIPDHHHHLDRWVEQGDRVAYEVTGTGTFTKPLRTPEGEAPPTGRSLNFRAGAISEVRDGKLVYDAFYFDQMELLGQLGLLPEPARR